MNFLEESISESRREAKDVFLAMLIPSITVDTKGNSVVPFVVLRFPEDLSLG